MTKTKKFPTSKVLSYFNGNKKQKPIKDARKIASLVGVPRRQVMLFLESESLRTYSENSYS